MWTYSATSTGYTLFKDGKQMGGAMTLGTSTHTSDGRRRHWKHKRADLAMHTETARRICEQKNEQERATA